MAPGEIRKTPQPNLPRRIGKYEVFLEIGSGGMARVYLAGVRGRPDGAEIVVVKVLRREVLEDEHVVALFMDEARIATRLHHPNVILTREVIAQPPDYLLAMEFQDGQSLLQVLRRLGRNAVPLDEHIWILTQVLAGLAHAHGLTDAAGRALAIVHRDVSPSNVLVCYSGEIKLLDFGIAKATGALAATQDGVVKGKVGYAAPEQCLGKPADPRSDIYAVGVMLWEAIAGRRRASGETWHSVLQARIDDAEPSLEEVCPDAPEALSAIAQRALAHEPEKRYATAQEFQRDLEAYLAARKATVTPARIAALIGPHFARDREEQRRVIDAYLEGQQSHVSGRRRIPLPGPIVPVPAPFEPNEEEDTSRIPVDDLLLMKSRSGSVIPPAGSSAPPMPAIPPVASNPPPLPKRGSPPPPARANAASSAPPKPAAPQGSSGLPSSPPRTSAVPGAPPSSRVSAPPSPPRASIAPSVDAAEGLAESATPRGRGRIVAVAAVALGVVAGVAWALRPRVRVEDVKPAAAVSSPAQAQAATPAAPTPQIVPTVNQVRVRIAVTPADAELRLDGLLLKGNPFSSVFPRSDEIHELRATADGFREERQAVQFIQDVDLEISLHRGRGAPRVTALRPVAPSAPAPARPAAEARPTTPAVEPGMDLKTKADTRGKRTIDEKDPYSQ